MDAPGIAARDALLAAADTLFTAQWGTMEQRVGVDDAQSDYDTAYTAWTSALGDQFSQIDLLIEVHKHAQRHPGNRLGQSLVSVCNTLFPDLAVQIVGDESKDPYYSDTNIEAYLTELQTLWDALE